MIEVVRPGITAARARAVIFDFDGTLSLVRSGWMEVMLPLAVEQLVATNSGESPDQLKAVAEEFIWRLTGKETIYQMMALADAIRDRLGTPEEPGVYKRLYLERLWQKIRHRVEALRGHSVSPETYLVPGARGLLDELRRRGLRLYLASGTDEANVREEATLLGIAAYFEGRIFGAQESLDGFSKARLVREILDRASGDLQPEELLVFGDGYVEIEEVKKAGGIAVGVATEEPGCLTVDLWKRSRLIDVGADFIVPNFTELPELTAALFQIAIPV